MLVVLKKRKFTASPRTTGKYAAEFKGQGGEVLFCDAIASLDSDVYEQECS